MLELSKPACAVLSGNFHAAITGEVVRIMISGLVKLGILKGDVDELIAQNAHRPFFMHGLSHWLGWTSMTLAFMVRIARAFWNRGWY
ncbi:hypothetical protein ACLK2C_15485 [Escherichia coli]